jgi:hypothetical protein
VALGDQLVVLIGAVMELDDAGARRDVDCAC